MPIDLTRLSRRDFLGGTLAAGATLLTGVPAVATTDRRDAHRVALLSDTHIAESAATVANGVRMAEHLRQAIDELIALETRPTFTLINGDCAYLDGKRREYELFFELVRPLAETGIPIHLTLGNHDDREHIWAAMPFDARRNDAVKDRHVSIVAAERANFFLLDTLLVPNTSPGRLGEAQLAWLAKSLDAATDKPAIVVMHHHPDPKQPSGALGDTNALLDVLRRRRHVKMLVFGHTHNWNARELDGIHLVNLPPVAYVFAKGLPSGWVDCTLKADRATLVLHAIDEKHPQHRQTLDLRWRT
jgi:3',5'-cyclic AMP phosphodiesterase CpdA